MAVDINSITPLVLDRELVRVLFDVDQTINSPSIETVANDNPRWNYLTDAGTGVTLSYSYRSTAPSYDPGGVDTGTYAALSLGEKSNIEASLAAWSDVADVTFEFEADPDNAQMVFHKVDILNPGVAGFAFFPPVGGPVVQNGDVFLDPVGAESMPVVVHEIGHALGLSHPFESGNRPVPEDFGFDGSELLSIMDYTSPPRDLELTVTHGGNGYSLQNLKLPEAPMPLDILAVQLLYGVNTTTRSGNTVYSFDVDPITYETIWDAGGNDTIDVSNQTRPSLISLVEGSYSTIALRDPFEGLIQEYVDNILATFPATRFFDGSNMLAIAFDAVIENAIGGSAGDVLIGNGVKNTLTGNDGNDTLQGAAGNDNLSGGTGEDSLLGGSGNDVLTGNGGADVMKGGTGNDKYFVGTGDVITEYKNQGVDIVQSNIDWSLGANFENLTLKGVATDGSGNSLNNIVKGNTAANTLAGLGGKDVLNGQGGNDTLSGGGGNDTLKGGGDRDSLTGGGGKDEFIGSGGSDTLVGGGGSDTLNGGSGKDVLNGGGGDDTLIGGTGDDAFVFDGPLSSANNVDTISDFTHLGDRIELDDDVFAAFSNGVAVTSAQLYKAPGATAAQDADDRIIYNTTTGDLYYDADGNAGGFSAVQFAVLTGAPALTPADFLIVA